MLYAGLKVIDPNTSLPKYVLINWVCILGHFVILSKNNHAKPSSLNHHNSLLLFMTMISTTIYTRKNLTTCGKSANKLSTSCVRTA